MAFLLHFHFMIFLVYHDKKKTSLQASFFSARWKLKSSGWNFSKFYLFDLYTSTLNDNRIKVFNPKNINQLLQTNQLEYPLYKNTSNMNLKIVLMIQFLTIATIWTTFVDCLIITSVIAGDKKFKTVSFHTKLLKPMTFESELPLTEFRRHRTLRPPKFDIDVNIPIKLPLEDEYPYEESKKPVESNIFFQTKEIIEPTYSKRVYPKKNHVYKDDISYASSQTQQKQALKQNEGQQQIQYDDAKVRRSGTGSIETRPFNVGGQQIMPRADDQGISANTESKNQALMAQESNAEYAKKGYAQPAYNQYQKPQYDYNPYQQQPADFIPGGFVNLKLSGPSGGPQMTYEDYDREKWAQQLSQTPGAMPYPILNYQQLQNYYGGLGTFTNGIAVGDRIEPQGLLEKLKSGIHHIKDKFSHMG